MIGGYAEVLVAEIFEFHNPSRSGMKIGVLSDTHIPVTVDTLPQQVHDYFKDVELILHAGDLVELTVLDEIKKITPHIKAISGNMDSLAVKKTLPIKLLIEIKGFKIGLIHGFGPPFKLMETVRSQFDRVDAIIYGHSHLPANEIHEGILFFNPGSPTDKNFAPYNSCGLLYIDSEIRGEIIRL